MPHLSARSFKLLCVLPAILLLSAVATAQLKADFTADKINGCSPLTVSLTNTTTGASPAATYSWDFGNGNASTLANPGTTYINEQTYTITLTVKDGTQTSTKSLTVTVYKKPVIDFTATPSQVCLPQPVHFSSLSTAGDGTITWYFWDFGDGQTDQGASEGQTDHTYTFAQNATVSLTITNSYGCQNTLQKQAVSLYAPIKASFNTDKTTLCQTGGAIQFTNTSTGTGPLSYSWDFGDGATSTDISPTHTYSQKGAYTVKLSVSSPGGCSDINTQVNLIHVADFVTDFSAPAQVCQSTQITFTDNSTPEPVVGVWGFSDGGTLATAGGAPAHYVFSQPGLYNVTLTKTYGGCPQVVVKQVNVLAPPNLKGFLINQNSLCGVPQTVNFTDTTSAATQWQWRFNYPNDNTGATTKSASFTYSTEGQYAIQLTVTNAAGCSASFIKPVSTLIPTAFITYNSTSSINGNSGCTDLTMTFTASSNSDPIAVYKWDFGDGGTATDASPTHHFTIPGTFIIHLNYTTLHGCQGTSEYSAVHVYQKPIPDFVAQPGTTICGNNPVFFADKTTGPITSEYWNFGDDNTYYFYTTSPTHQYYNDKLYTVTLIANNELCSDTIVKTDYIKVLPPFPFINQASNTCDGTRGTITFGQASRKALQWIWDFGDGSTPLSLNTDQPVVQHTYTKTGLYHVVLTAVNGSCAVPASNVVAVLLKQSPMLESSAKDVCASNGLNIVINNLDVNPEPNEFSPFEGYDFNTWQFQDSHPFTGTLQPASMPGGSNSYSGIIQGLPNMDQDSLRIILKSATFGCYDTSNYIPVRIKGPSAGYTIPGNNVCYKSPIILQDTAHGNNGVPIQSYHWTFGDGQSATYTTPGQVAHYYAGPGIYDPVLTVTDMDGCTAGAVHDASGFALVNGPKAAFFYSPAAISPNTLISFYNATNTVNSINTQYSWDFGDGTGATSLDPTHSYPAISTDTVKLIVQSPFTGCRDTAIQVLYVKTVHAAFSYTTTYINNNSCPPVLVLFSNTAINASRLAWNFGDGSTADNQPYPSHTYNQPGVYIATLYAYGADGVIDSSADTITITGPYAKIQADTLSGCTGQTVNLSALVKNAASFIWDFADGVLDRTTDTFAIHRYLTGGVYTPSLIMTDANGCAATSSLGKSIVIDSLHIGFDNLPPHVCDSTWVTFTPAVKSVAADRLQQSLFYKWDFGTGLPQDTSNAAIPQFMYHQPGNYPLTLQVSSTYGCTQKITGGLQVVAPEPFQLQTLNNTYACPGAPFQLQVSGAVFYSWINTTGLDNNTLPDPMASPPLQTDYTVVGYDRNHCFSDTATIHIQMAPSPTVSADESLIVPTGSTITLNARGSNDVTQWSWSPSDWLSCTDCPSPQCTPRNSIDYIVTVKNEYKCPASDTISLKLICEQGRVYIPNGFSPDGDGKNDVFYIKGTGIRIIKYLRIFNRWGEIIFERANFNIDDRSSGWDGNFKGHPAEPGTYVYIAELVCDSGETFPMKGSLILVR